MGLFGNLFTSKNNNSSKTPASQASTPKTASPVKKNSDYAPMPANEEKLLAELEEAGKKALSEFYASNESGMKWITTSEEERYREYRQLPQDVIKQKAAQGDANAQYLMGDSLLDQNNANEALKWFKKSADGGNADSQYLCGAILQNGDPSVRDINLAIEYYRKAAVNGLCYMASQELVELIDVDGGYENIKELIKWLSYLVYSSQGTEDEWKYNLRASALCSLLTEVDLEGLWQIGLEHIKDPNFTRYSEMERIILMGFYFERTAMRTGMPDDMRDDAGDMLCKIGEIGLELDRPYARDVLYLAVAKGDDYANAVAAKPLIFEAGKNHVSLEDRENSTYFQRMRQNVEKLTRDNSSERHQAHALVALSLFYDLGAGVARNYTMAYRFLERAANMKYGFAQHMTQMYERMPNGEYRRRQ